MNPSVIVVFSVIVLMFFGFLLLKRSFWVITSMALITLMLFGILTPAEAFSGFSNPNVIMIFGMMVVSGALRKTRMVTLAQSFLSRINAGDRKTEFLFVLGAFILAQFLSGVVVLSIMMPLIAAIDTKSGKLSVTRIIYPIAVVSDLTNSVMPIGMGATISAQNNAMMGSLGVTETLPVYNLFLNSIIGSVLVITYFTLFYDRVLPARPTNAIDTSGLIDMSQEQEGVDPGKEKMAYLVFFGTSTMILVSAFVGWPLFMPALIGAILMLLTGVLTEKEFFGTVPWGVIVLLATCLPLTNAISNTGAGDVIGNALTIILGKRPPYVLILFVIYVVGSILTQIVSNGAAWFILVPLVTLTAQKLGISPLGLVSIVEISAVASLFTPMASPTMALAFGAGGYSIKDLCRAGFPAWLLMGLSAIAVICLRYPV